MSKVKSYMDGNKEKALHRNRIDETRRTKANRIKKCNNGTYHVFQGGYEHITEKHHNIYEFYEEPEWPYTYKRTDWDYFNKTGKTRTITVHGVVPAHLCRRWVGTDTVSVSMLKRWSIRRKKIFKTQAKRQFRSKNRLTDENSYLLKGNTYKKDYDIQWRIW